MLQIENGRTEEMKTKISFLLDVRLSPVIYRDARCSKKKTRANPNGNNFLFGCLTESRNISRPSKLKMEAPSKFEGQ